MKTVEITIRNAVSLIMSLCILMVFSITNAQIGIDKDKNFKPETELPEDVLWDVKAYMPEGVLFMVKAINPDGSYLKVKALQSYGDTSILDVKALDNGDIIPVKLVVEDNSKNYVLKAIKKNGDVLEVKAISSDGGMYPIQGVIRTGNTVVLRAMVTETMHLKVFAIAPDGHVNLLKGIKMLDSEVETVVNGVKVYSHVKAVYQN